MYLVIKHEEERGDVGVNLDGTTCDNLDDADLMSEDDADKLAASVGGSVIDEQRAFPGDWEDDE